METKHPRGCFLCNQLKVRVSGGFNGSVRDRRARRIKGMLFCPRNRPFRLRLLAPTEYMPTSDLLPLTPERERVRQRLVLILKVVNSQMVFCSPQGVVVIPTGCSEW